MRLIDIVFRPIKTSRRILRIMRDCEMKLEYNPKRVENAEVSGFVVIEEYGFMIPSTVFKMIEKDIVLVKGSGYGANRIWQRKEGQKIDVANVPFANAVAMCVNERLEQANGN